MPVEVDPDIGVKARTVGELRKVKALPENLAITTPPQLYPGGVIKVGRCNVSTRVSPKT